MEDKPLVIDIETSGLLADMLDYSSFPYKLKSDAKLWCVVVRNIRTGEVFTAVKEEVTAEWLKTVTVGCTHLIGHNAIKFDFITLKLFGVLDYKVGYLGEDDLLFGNPVKIVDTLILSRLFNPDRHLGHSLYSWGVRVNNFKIGFREQCIELGIIEKNSPKGSEFLQWSDIMLDYCIGDTSTNADTFFALVAEMMEYNKWGQAIKMENKLADLAIRRESLGFWFDKDLALKCIDDLTQKMEELQNKVNPILPKKPMTKSELGEFTPPKTQVTKDGNPSSYLLRFAERVGGEIVTFDKKLMFRYKEEIIPIPFEEPLETHKEADISNLDHVKSTLIDDYGWIPVEWAERDLTKDSKKQNISLEKQTKALERWYEETIAGKYKKLRLEIACEKYKANEENLLEVIKSKLGSKFPVKVSTSPKVRVGVEKELCPNLIKLGERVSFANDFALFLTYKHRKSSIAGGDLEDVDYDNEYPNTGFLSMYRESDGRVSTPSIEIGANTNRYRHIGICNISRPTSIYGKEMRSLFGCGKDAVFFGFDYSSIEARIMAHYVYKYKDGIELGKTFVAEKPNDLHTKMGLIMDLPRSEAKSINFGIIYGASWPKIKKMTGKTEQQSKDIVDGFWTGAPALREFKDKAVEYWKSTGSSYVPAIDGRKIYIRSEHSICNALFQSGAVIYAKYIATMFMEKLEKEYDLCIDPFVAKPDVCCMIEYHDEQDLFANPNLFKFKVFDTKEFAEEFIKNWQGEQLSAIGEAKGKFYVALPNPISKAVAQSMREAEEFLKINVTMGFEYMLGRTWYDCH